VKKVKHKSAYKRPWWMLRGRQFYRESAALQTWTYAYL